MQHRPPATSSAAPFLLPEQGDESSRPVSTQISSQELPQQYSSSQEVPLQRSTENTHLYLPCHYFDYIAGTSTGEYVHTLVKINDALLTFWRLIAIMLGRLRMGVDDC